MTQHKYGDPLFGKLHYCTRCCMPESNEGIKFDEMGICQACQSSEQKMHINWVEREAKLRQMLNQYKNVNADYDCIVPISGGKDSAFQLYVVTQVYGLRPLAVTFSHNWFTETGKYNLTNCLEQFQVDHVMFTPNRNLINRLARRSLVMIGDACWHCHSGVGAFSLQTAVRYKIPLLIWVESAAESSGRATHYEPVHKFDREYFQKISAKVGPEAMVGENLKLEELSPWRLPSVEEIEEVGVVGIHLGDYIFWDDERQMEFVRDRYGWREDDVEGTYKGYKSVECRMAGVHDYTKFLKRGFGRGTDHASADVRAGLATREEAFELAKKYDTERPPGLDYYLSLSGYSEAEFMSIMADHRKKLSIPGLSDDEFQQAVQEYHKYISAVESAGKQVVYEK